MDFLSIIAHRRDGTPHSREELVAVADAAATGSVPDYQLAAWLMAAYLNPLSPEETALFTQAIADGGTRLDLTGLPKPWVDKHSTGGVGDKTTLVLLPLLAACGLTMVKMSGRGLGITGGTLDKLASVPGLNLDRSPDELVAIAREAGFALGGQTSDLAPADKALYALRDVTGTVASLPLIVSSILSKKIAGGAETVVLDVKCGAGAFMPTVEAGQELASALRTIGEKCGLNVRCALTDMNMPLGAAVGNALEVREAWDVLSGQPLSAPVERFRELCLDLAGIALQASGHGDRNDAEMALASGRAAEKFQAWARVQGATQDVPEGLPWAPFTFDLEADRTGWIAGIDAAAVGQAAIELGGGRKRKEDVIDPAVGVVLQATVGSSLDAGQTVLTVHAANEEVAARVAQSLRAAIRRSDEPVTLPSALLIEL